MHGKFYASTTHLPESHVPAEFLGISRDMVKLLVINRKDGTISSDLFFNVSGYLDKGDLLIVNNSSLVNASLPCYFHDLDELGYLNIGTDTIDNLRIVEPRPVSLNEKLSSGSTLELIGPGKKLILEKRDSKFPRFWWADMRMECDKLQDIEWKYGSIIRYRHVSFPVPLKYYNSIFSSKPGSFEPPSASIPFTGEVRRSVEEKGVDIAEITLHCNLGSMEEDEFESTDSLLNEDYSLPCNTVRKIVETKRSGGRVIAVGTTAVRAVESFFKKMPCEELNVDMVSGEVSGCGEFGKTDLFVRPGYKFRVIGGLITGMHDPYSSHIEMMSAFAGRDLLDSSYNIAMELGYLWHEFGDITLVI